MSIKRKKRKRIIIHWKMHKVSCFLSFAISSNEHVFKLDFGDVGFNEFAYFYFQTDYVMNWLESNGGKAAIPGINQSVVNSIWIFHPAHPIVKEFCNFIKPIITQVLKNCYQNMRLSELRDSILPHLMSGELDVSELEI